MFNSIRLTYSPRSQTRRAYSSYRSSETKEIQTKAVVQSKKLFQTQSKGYTGFKKADYSNTYKSFDFTKVNSTMNTISEQFKLNETRRLRPTAFSLIESMTDLYALWKEMTTKPSPIGKPIWTNPKKDEIEAEVRELHKNDSKRGIIGFHCTSDKEEMLAQAKQCSNGSIEYRENCHGEGLYVGDAEGAAHFAGQKDGWIFKIASTCRYSTNSDYGTNTTYLTGGGQVYILEAYELNPEFSDFRRPWIWEVATKFFQSRGPQSPQNSQKKIDG